MKNTKYSKKGFWTKDKCHEEALKYNTKKDFKEKSISVYSICVRRKWIDDICEHMVELVKAVGYWTKERCLEEIKKYGRTELRKTKTYGKQYFRYN